MFRRWGLGPFLLQIFIQLIFTVLGAAADPRPILFGPEWNYFVRGMSLGKQGSNHSLIDRYRQMLLIKIKQRCKSKGCNVDLNSGKVAFQDGFWLQVETDIGTIEIIAKPHTLAEFEARKTQLQKFLFDSTEAVGLKPKFAGHIHVGVQSAFGTNALAFRNFIVDWVNHPELGTHILHQPNHNSTPISILPLKQRLAFAKVIQEFDARKINGIYELAKAIQERVYYQDIGDHGSPYKYQELNLSRIVANPSEPERWTIELRLERPEKRRRTPLGLESDPKPH